MRVPAGVSVPTGFAFVAERALRGLLAGADADLLNASAGWLMLPAPDGRTLFPA